MALLLITGTLADARLPPYDVSLAIDLLTTGPAFDLPFVWHCFHPGIHSPNFGGFVLVCVNIYELYRFSPRPHQKSSCLSNFNVYICAVPNMNSTQFQNSKFDFTSKYRFVENTPPPSSSGGILTSRDGRSSNQVLPLYILYKLIFCFFRNLLTLNYSRLIPRGLKDGLQKGDPARVLRRRIDFSVFILYIL